ncbi:MAG: chalcone isomerase family protein [Cycloclasticus sp.]
MNKIFTLLLLLHTANTNANKLHLDDLNLVGRSNFSVWFWDIYDIELKTPSGTYEEGKRPLSLELTYKRAISNIELVDETLTQLKRFNISEEQKKNWAKQLLEIWPSVKPSDTITVYIDNEKITYFYFNGQLIGKINEVDFSDTFPSIWLSLNGPYPALTKKLTGSID